MATWSPSSEHLAIDPRTTMGAVRLTVSDIDRSRLFYERALGLRAKDGDDGTITMHAAAGPALVELHGDSSAARLDPRNTGLFHLAVLVPSRLDLAFALARLGSARWPLDGASDHLVSEALYLSDPDGNGIEIYRDRPRDEWRRSDGELEMATLPLDLQGLARELSSVAEPQTEAPPGTRIGHTHLQVSELDEIEAFYVGVLGFDVIVRHYPGALFVSAGGYHHHLGLNTWNSRGSGPAPPGSVGLRSFEVQLADKPALDAVLGRIDAAGLTTEVGAAHGTHIVRDPSGNAVELCAADLNQPRR
jgi:catechol 2,3-dioxygenase